MSKTVECGPPTRLQHKMNIVCVLNAPTPSTLGTATYHAHRSVLVDTRPRPSLNFLPAHVRPHATLTEPTANHIQAKALLARGARVGGDGDASRFSNLVDGCTLRGPKRTCFGPGPKRVHFNGFTSTGSFNRDTSTGSLQRVHSTDTLQREQ